MKRNRVSSHSSLSSATLLPSAALSSSPHAAKYTVLEPSSLETTTAMCCSLPPHAPLDFSGTDSYESHYRSEHTHRCVECHKNFPSQHYLDLHITEEHDPIAATRRDAGEKVYACFVEGCEKVCRDWKKRRCHLIDKHAFPRNFDFFVVWDGTDNKRSLLRPGVDENGHRKSTREKSPRTEGSALGAESQSGQGRLARPDEKKSTDEREDSAVAHAHHPVGEDADKPVNKPSTSTKDPMEDITTSLSALKMVPRSISFGKRKGKSGFSER